MSRKVALVIHALHGGGAERLISQLASRWAELHEVHLLTWSEVDSDQYELAAQIQRHSLGLLRESRGPVDALVSNLRRVKRLRSKLREIDPDLMLSFCDRTNIVALQASGGLRAAKWISEHSNPARQHLGRIWEKWRQRTYRNCDGCTVLTPDIAEWMSALISPDRIRVIPPSISLPPHLDNLSKAASRGATPLPQTLTPDRKRILFVGRLSAEKRVDRLINAWKQLEAKLPEWELVLVGGGPEESNLRTRAREQTRVIFTGWCDRPSRYYENADLFALPSDYEGFPVSLLEAMAHGLAGVATNSTKALEQINHPEPCVSIADQDDGKSLAEELLRLATDSELRSKRARLSRQRSSEFSWERIGPQWDRILDELPS
ncbi:MAG: glycosyltransferase [Aureliella sp.]